MKCTPEACPPECPVDGVEDRHSCPFYTKAEGLAHTRPCGRVVWSDWDCRLWWALRYAYIHVMDDIRAGKQ